MGYARAGSNPAFGTIYKKSRDLHDHGFFLRFPGKIEIMVFSLFFLQKCDNIFIHSRNIPHN